VVNDQGPVLSELPWLLILPLGIAVLAGVVLWVSGGRLIRPALGLVGLLVGSTVGWVAGQAFNLGWATWAVVAVAAVIVGFLASRADRMAVPALLALMLGVAAPTGLMVVLITIDAFSGDEPPGAAPATMAAEDPPAEDPWIAGAPDYLVDFLEQVRKAAGSPADDGARSKRPLDEVIPERVAEARGEADRIWAAARRAWDKAPQKLAAGLAGSSLVGALVGLIMGVVAPTFSAALVTALIGSALWVRCGGALVTLVGLPGGSLLPRTVPGWLLVWIAASVIGLGIQWMYRAKPADNAG